MTWTVSVTVPYLARPAAQKRESNAGIFLPNVRNRPSFTTCSWVWETGYWNRVTDGT